MRREVKGITSMAMVSSSLMSCRAPTSSQVTSGTVAKPSLLAEGCTLAREAWKSAMRRERPPRISSDRVWVFFRRPNSCHSAPCWTPGSQGSVLCWLGTELDLVYMEQSG